MSTPKRKALGEYQRERRAYSGGKYSLDEDGNKPKNRSFTAKALDEFNKDNSPFIKAKMNIEFQKWITYQTSEESSQITRRVSTPTSPTLTSTTRTRTPSTN